MAQGSASWIECWEDWADVEHIPAWNHRPCRKIEKRSRQASQTGVGHGVGYGRKAEDAAERRDWHWRVENEAVDEDKDCDTEDREDEGVASCLVANGAGALV